MSIFTPTARANAAFSYIRWALRLRAPLAFATMCLAVLGLLSNSTNFDGLLRPLGDSAAMHPVTAFGLFAIGLCTLRLKRFAKMPIWQHVLGALVVSICATRIMEAITQQTTGASGWVMFGPSGGFTGQFSVETSIALGAFAMAMLARQALGRWGIAFLVAGLACVSNMLIEISYGQTVFNGDVGLLSLLGLGCCAAGMVTMYINRPFVRVPFMSSAIGSQTRVMAIAVIAVPWACGFFLQSTVDVNGSAVPTGAAVMSVVMWSMMVILLATSSRHDSADAARRRAERHIEAMTRIDPLTQALNRFGMNEVLEEAWGDFKTSGTKFGMLLLDVTYFKRINETFGRDAGEDVLERVAKSILPHLRSRDALGRWSGEEFLILLRIKNTSDLDVVTNRLRAALSDVNSPFCAKLDGEPTQITASFGTSDMRDSDDGPIDAMRRADHGLYLAKERNRDHGGAQYDMILDDEALAFDEDGEHDSAETSDTGKDSMAA